MSILGSIMSSILGSRAQAPPPPPTAVPPAESQGPSPSARAHTPPAQPPRKPQAGGSAGGPQATPQPAQTSPAPAAAPQVDVAAVLDKLAAESAQKLDWRMSIVDLMKLLKLDSSLAARKALAEELNYSGDTKDTAAMNVWLHKQVMAKLVEGGGKLPADLKP